MNTNDFTMYMTIIILGGIILNKVYNQVRLIIAKSNGAIYHRISQEEAFESMKNDKSIINIDVRTPQEFKTGHIKGAINHPNINTITAKYTNKDTKMFINCQTGSRSSKVSKKLVMKGYTNIYDIGGLSS